MPWYEGPTLLERLETLEPADASSEGGFCLPVQWVNRPDADFRGYAGRVVRGRIRPGDAVRVLPGGRETRVGRIVTLDGDLQNDAAGQSVTLVTADEVDVGRGDVVVASSAPLEIADQFETTLLWLDDEPLLPGRPYWLKLGTQTVSATVTDIRHQINVNTQEHLAARRLELNAIAVCKLSLDRPVPFEPYAANRDLGGFILIDRVSNRTAAAGMLHFALRRAHNIHLQALEVDRQARAALKGQKPCVVWFTGLSGSGKSTLANALEKRLHAMGRHTCLLDGDNIRHGLCKDLGFSDADREENIRRIGEVSKLFLDAGVVVLTAFVSPFKADRARAPALVAAGDFVEIHCAADLAVCDERDTKGLYAKARAGEIKEFTGISDPYEAPTHAELVVDTENVDVDHCAHQVLLKLEQMGLIRA